MPDTFTAYASPEAVSIVASGVPFIRAVAEASNMGLGTWYVNRVLVEADHRGKGIGGRLLEALKTECAKLGCAQLLVEPGGYGQPITRQRRFYRAHGFVKKKNEHNLYRWCPEPANQALRVLPPKSPLPSKSRAKTPPTWTLSTTKNQ